MPFLIDGDNLLHATRGAFDGAEHAGRAWLCRLLSAWDAQGRQEVTVIFDGVRPPTPGDGPVTEGALIIRYSDNETADDLIIEAIEASSARRRLTVVSSDHEVRTAARRRRAQSVDSATFIEQVQRDLQRSTRKGSREPREKYHGLEPGQTDEWLKAFGLGPAPDDGDDEPLLL